MIIEKRIAKELDLKLENILNTVKLLDEGNTVPFIARYRKEQTGAMEDVKIRDLAERLNFLRELEERKIDVKRLIRESLKLEETEALPDNLEEEIDTAETLTRLDDLYRPYRPKRRTRAIIAKKKGLEPVADLILQGEMAEGDFINFIEENHLTKEVETVEEAIQGAEDIIAEIISDDPEIRERVRGLFERNGYLKTEVTDKEKDEKRVYEIYYDNKEPVRDARNHRILAMNRGEKEDILRVKLEIDIDVADSLAKQTIRGNKNLTKYYEEAIIDGYDRLLFPSVEREIRNQLREKAEEEAIDVFANNLEPLLLQAPLKGRGVLAIDPGFRTGAKLAALDEIGNILDYATVYPTHSKRQIEEAKAVMAKFIKDYSLTIVAIGNGTASRETEEVVAEMINENNLDASYVIVDESGASVYSASDIAREELPDLDVSIRGAVSIGRRIQDPLAELVKIDPKSIGVGQYQHDLNQNRLDEALKAVVEDSVNTVGVDLNTASPSLLSYVSGISNRVANNIFSKRNELGRFTDRKELLDVTGLGPKTYIQAAGFLRIADGNNLLDNTAVHPESYLVAEVLLDLDYETKPFDELYELVSEKIDVGHMTLKDIIEELKKPGRDPRDEMEQPELRKDILSIEDLRPDMIVSATIRNVVDFGAFADIGVGDDGLIHISQLADTFVKNPHDFVKVGDIVNVKILDIDIDTGRISLSMKGVENVSN